MQIWSAIGICALLFLTSLVVQVLWWRIQRPVGYLIWLSFIWLALPILVSLGLYQANVLAVDPILLGLALELILGTCCVNMYAGIVERSPSDEMCNLMARMEKTGGLPVSDITKINLSNDQLVFKRLDHLVFSKLVDIDGHKIKINEKGIRLTNLLSTYRKIIGVPPLGEG